MDERQVATDGTIVVHVNDPDGYDVYIGRAVGRRNLPASPWANPFRVDDVGRKLAISLFRDWVHDSPECSALWMREHAHELLGKRLGCWCRPKHTCHGDVLAELAREFGIR